MYSWTDGEFAARAPCARLRGLVVRIQGYSLSPGRPLWRRELPGTSVPLLLTFEGAFRLGGAQGTDLVAGLQESCRDTLWPARVSGIQVDFTPLGAHLFFGVPLDELTGQIAALDDVLGRRAELSPGRLAELPTWEARFALVEEAVLARTAVARRPAPALTWAWQRIHTSGGRTGVQELAAELECSRQHLSTGFRRAFGMPPKALARIRRFERAARWVEAGGLAPAEIALRAGYYDQAHFNRDFRLLAGCSPGAHLLLREREPGGPG